MVGKKMLNVLRRDVSVSGSYGEREFFNAEMRVLDGFDENGNGFALRGKLYASWQTGTSVFLGGACGVDG